MDEGGGGLIRGGGGLIKNFNLQTGLIRKEDLLVGGLIGEGAY